MSFNYFDENNKLFYYKEGEKKAKYNLLFIITKLMAEMNKKEDNFVWLEGGLYKLKIIKIIDSSKFEFTINDSPKLYILGKKKIYFQDKDGKVTEEIYVYNREQIFEIQEYFIQKNEHKNVEIFDNFGKLINMEEINDNEFDFFLNAHYLKVVEENDESIKKKNQEYFKNLFDTCIKNKFKNDGEKLSFNLEEYSNQKAENFHYIDTELRNQIFFELDDFIHSDEEYKAFTGISGTGKTITLLKFLSRISNNYPNCYLNIKSLIKKSDTEKLASEFVKLFNKDYLGKYYTDLIELLDKKNNILLWDKIIEIFDFIVGVKEIKNKIIIIIDQYKIGYDQNLKLINILQLKKYTQKIKFIICSSIHETDIKSNITYSTFFKKLGLKNIIIFKFLNSLFSVEKIIKNDKIKDLMKQFNYIPKYYYQFISKYHVDEKEVKDKDLLIQKINKFLFNQFETLKNKFKCFYFENNVDLINEYNNICRILQGEKIKETNIFYIIETIPLKYCIYKIFENNIQISPAFDFIFGPLRQVYKEASVHDLINVAKISENRGEIGNIFDSLVNHHFDLGKKIFGFQISHVIIANEIVDFLYFKKIVNEYKDYYLMEEIDLKKLFDRKVIFLEQFNSNGKCVDGGFLIPIPNTDSFALLLYQSSIKKRKHFSKKYIYNYIYKNTKTNLNKTFGIDIQKIYFMYIIDMEDKSTINYCVNTGIYYIFYDYKRSKFLYGNNSEINEFSERIFSKMEIQEPNPEVIELLENQENSNDISSFKKILLNKKRKLKTDSEEIKKENNEKKNLEFKKTLDNIKIIKTKNGYKNEKAILEEINYEELEKISNKTNLPKEKQKVTKKIPNNLQNIFKGYDSYEIIKKNLSPSNAIFGLPFFYIYDNKYIIVKNENDKEEIYSFYDFNTGVKLEESLKKKVLESLNIFGIKEDKILTLDAYYLIEKE